jgi:hypothetical protein
MLSVDAEISPIVADYEIALATLVLSLNHVSNSAPSAELRVLFLNSSIVSLVSVSEEVLRNLFQQYLLCVQRLVSDHRRLRRDLQKSNIERGFELLKRLDMRSSSSRARELISLIDGCLKGENNYQLFREQLTYNQGNFRTGQITEVAKKCGISGVLKMTCNCQEFSEYFNDEDVERKVTRFTAKWNEIFDERDTIVHRISQASGWADERIRQAVDFFLLVVRRLAKCLVDDANSLVES